MALSLHPRYLQAIKEHCAKNWSTKGEERHQDARSGWPKYLEHRESLRNDLYRVKHDHGVVLRPC